MKLGLKPYLQARLTRQFWQRLVVVSTVALLTAYVVNKTAHLYIDNQAQTSITNRHYYLLNHWQTVPKPTALSNYKAYYLSLTTEQQQAFRTYTYKVWQNHQPLALVNQWLEHTLHLEKPSLTSIGSIDQIKTPITDLPTAHYLTVLGSSIYGFKNHHLVPQLPYSQNLVKYVVAQAGDIITLTPQGAFVNGIFIKAYLPQVQQQVAQRLQLKEFTLAPYQYWVMGDNPQSIDSNFFGPVQKEQFFGKVWWSH